MTGEGDGGEVGGKEQYGGGVSGRRHKGMSKRV